LFSGIVEGLGKVVAVTKPKGNMVSISLDMGRFSESVRIGNSVSVNGVCLTVTSKRKKRVSFDVIEETLRLTNLGELVRGSRVNLERGLSLSSRIDGHLVTGHIDGTGVIEGTERMEDGSVKMWVQAGRKLAATMIPKGSVAIDGISLTLVDVAESSFSVCLIPHTLSKTTLGIKKQGQTVNIEADMIGKYVKKLVQQMELPERPSSIESRMPFE
jgi:riboflavin synthase